MAHGAPEGSAVVMLCTKVYKSLWLESEVTCTLSHRTFVLEQMIVVFATVVTHLPLEYIALKLYYDSNRI